MKGAKPRERIARSRHLQRRTQCSGLGSGLRRSLAVMPAVSVVRCARKARIAAWAVCVRGSVVATRACARPVRRARSAPTPVMHRGHWRCSAPTSVMHRGHWRGTQGCAPHGESCGAPRATPSVTAAYLKREACHVRCSRDAGEMQGRCRGDAHGRPGTADAQPQCAATRECVVHGARNAHSMP